MNFSCFFNFFKFKFLASSNSNTSTSSNSNTNLLNSSLNYVNVNAKPMISLIPLNANKLENE